MTDIESLPKNPNEWPIATLTGIDLKPQLARVDQAIVDHALARYSTIKPDDTNSLYVCGDGNQKLIQLAVELGILTPSILVPKFPKPSQFRKDKPQDKQQIEMDLRFPTGIETNYEVVSATTSHDEPFQQLQRLALTTNRKSAGDIAIFGYQLYAHDNYAGNNPSYGGIAFAPLHEVSTIIGRLEDQDHYYEKVAMGYGKNLPVVAEWALLGIHLPMRLLPVKMLQNRFMDQALRSYALTENSPVIERHQMQSWEQFLKKHQADLVPKTYEDLTFRLEMQKVALGRFSYD